MNRPAASLLLAAVLLAASGCQKTERLPELVIRDNSASVAMLQGVNTSAQNCWIKSKDKDFRAYSVIPELDTRTGKPRLLVVERKAAQGLPKLVIEAEGKPAQVQSYGPLADGPLSARIDADVKRWSAGNPACTA